MAVFALALLAAACGGSATQVRRSSTSLPSPVATGVPSETAGDLSGWVGTDPAGVEYLRWTEAGGQLSGQLQAVYVTTARPLDVQSINAPFTGVRSGTNLTITLGELGVSFSLTGTLTEGSLTLVGAGENGLLATIALKPGAVDDYNRAASAFTDRIHGERAQAASEAAAANRLAAEQTAIADDDHHLRAALSTLTDAVNQLARDTSFDAVLKSYAAHWATMQNDYQKEQQDAAVTPLTCYQRSVVEYDRSVVDYDLSTVQFDDSSLSGVSDSLTSDIQTIQRHIAGVRSALMSLEAAMSVGVAHVAPQYGAPDVDAGAKAAQNQINTSTQALASAKAQAASFDAEAAQLDQTAKTLASGLRCSG